MKKISTKVLIPVVLLAVIAVISAVTGLKNANELHTSSKEISDTTVNQLMLLNDISSNFKSIDAITYRMCVSTSKDERDQLMEQVNQYRTDIQTSIDSYEALTQTQEEAAAMETLRENFADYTEVYDRIADFISRGNKDLSLIHISEPTRQAEISYAVFCLKKKKNNKITPSPQRDRPLTI